MDTIGAVRTRILRLCEARGARLRHGFPRGKPRVADALLPVARIAGYVQRDHPAVSAVFRVRLRYGAFGALPVQVYYLGIVHILTSCSVIRPLSPI